MGYSINGETKVITLTTGTTNVSVRDLWSRWVDWLKLSDNSKYLAAMVSIGGVPINEAEGTFIPVYVFLTNGWRIKPQESNHTLNVKDGILLVNGGGDPFINTTGSFVVRINYQQPVQAISFSTGGGTTNAPTVEEIRQEIDDNSIKLNELHRIQGLDINNPLTITPSDKSAGNINLDLTGDGANVTVVTRI